MPRLPGWATDCSVYLYKDRESAGRGAQGGGCGFVMAVPANAGEPLRPREWWGPRPPESRSFYYAVTNRHVAKSFPVLRLNRQGGGAEALEPEEWFYPPDSVTAPDLAVAPLDLSGEGYRLTVLPLDMIIASPEYLDIGLGDEVFIMSRFLRYDGKRTNYPAARSGIVSVMPREDDPIRVDEVGLQVAYLIEVRTIPGASGSPVILHIPGWELRESERTSPRRELYEAVQSPRSYLEGDDIKVSWRDQEIPTPPFVALLGVSGGYLYGRNEKLMGVKGQPAGLKVPTLSGMAWCVPSWKLLDLLREPRLRAQREALRREWDVASPAGGPC